MVVSQFTLFATFKMLDSRCRAHPGTGHCDNTAVSLGEASTVRGRPVRTPVEPADGHGMSGVGVELVNDGPVTVELLSSPTPSTPSTAAPSTSTHRGVQRSAGGGSGSGGGSNDAAGKSEGGERSGGSADEVEEILRHQPYLGGFLPTHRDREHFDALQSSSTDRTRSATARWYEHVGSFCRFERDAWWGAVSGCFEAAVEIKEKDARKEQDVERLSRLLGFSAGPLRAPCGCPHHEFCTCGRQWKLDKRQRGTLRNLDLSELLQLLIHCLGARAAEAGVLPSFAPLLSYLASQISRPWAHATQAPSRPAGEYKNLKKYLKKFTCENMVIVTLAAAELDQPVKCQVRRQLEAIRQSLKRSAR
eukprot:g2536.t1